MKTIVDKISCEEILIDPETVILDIETTGLSRKNDLIITIGLLYGEDGEVVTEQYFAESLIDEVKLIEKFLERIKSFDTVLTYNGDSFDLPFIRGKINFYGFEDFNAKQIDLYKTVRKYKDILGLQKTNQKEVEKYLHIERRENLKGSDVALLYKNFLLKGAPAEEIILHNKYDLINLHKILKIEEVIADKMTVETNLGAFTIKDFKVNKNLLTLTGVTNCKNIFYSRGTYELQVSSNTFTLEVFLEEESYDRQSKCKFVKRATFPDVKDYSQIEFPAALYPISLSRKVFTKNIVELAKEIIKQEMKA